MDKKHFLGDGYYELKNVPVGEYNLVAFQVDGNYQPFQQGAVIAENSVTPASLAYRQRTR
jgi:hypothetical protein